MIFNALIFFRLTLVSVAFSCFVRACFSKSLIKKSTAALLQPSFIGSTTAPIKQKRLTLYTLLSNYLTKATPQGNTLGRVFYNIFL